MKIARSVSLIFLLTVFVLAGCTDSGSTVPPTAPTVPPVTTDSVYFAADVLPVLTANCVGCHGGTNGLFVDTYETLMGSALHGPVVIPGNGEGSTLIKKLRGTTFGVRMPQGGPYLPDSVTNKISRWIQQGAKKN
jgi:Planctomycete cytochrome C